MAQARTALGIALLTPLLCGCAVVASLLEPIYGEDVPPVDQYAQLHVDDLRWGRVQQAALPVVPERREAFLALFDDAERPFRFTSIEIVSAQAKGDDEPAAEYDVLVAYEFYRPPAVSERKLRQHQTWRFDPETEQWTVDPDLEVFAAR